MVLKLVSLLENNYKILAFMITLFLFCEGEPQQFPGVHLSPDYDRAYPPPGKIQGQPVMVNFSISVRTVAPIQSAEMEFRVNMRLTMEWFEPRLSVNLSETSEDDCLDYLIASGGLKKQLWLPDPYIVNAKYSAIKKFDDKLENVYLFENQKVAYTFIANTTVACEMNFEFYPSDIQLCPMIIQSFVYDATRVEFQWKSDTLEQEAFSVRPMRLIQFMVTKPPKPKRKFVSDFHQGNVTQLIATFRFERLVGSHLVQSFIPCTLVVILSWFSFWLELDVTSTRGYLLMTSILTIQVHLGGLKTEFPPVAYIKAVDIWLFGCMFWIFCALAQFVLVKAIYSKTQEIHRENEVRRFQTGPIRDFDVVGQVMTVVENENATRNLGSGQTRPPMEPLLTPYTRFWLWEELQHINVLENEKPTKNICNDDNDESPSPLKTYRKRRLGSVVLSGRSVATSHLPIMEMSFCCGLLTLPLVWEKKNSSRRVLWREIDYQSRWIFPLGFAIFASGYWIVLLWHSHLV